MRLQSESHLDSTTVAKEFAILLFSNANLGASDDGAGKRCAEQVAVFVDSVALHYAEHSLLDKSSLRVLSDHSFGSKRKSLFLNSGEIFLL